MADTKTIACGLTLDEITALSKTVADNKLGRIKLKSGDSEVVIEGVRPVAAPVMPMGAITAPAVQNAASDVPTTETVSKAVEGNVVKSPIVGTYYASPAPDKAPFVKIGDTVKKGDVIMIIESMKLMNEVKSGFDGTVKEILVENGDAVEFDQPIMVIG